jgi:hypothetical protein
MQIFNASNLMQVAKLLAIASRYPTSPRETKEWKAAIPLEQRDQLSTFMETIEHDCMTFNLKASMATVRRIRQALGERPCTQEILAPHMSELEGRLRDELANTLILSFPQVDGNLLNDPISFFGPIVSERFPSAVRDMEEAARCLGFDRATASVFHLLRVLEVALRALHIALEAKDPAKSTRSWAMYLKLMRDSIDERRSTLGDMLAYYERAHVSLMSIDRAWRNPTMHVENSYNMEEALDIATHVTSFLRFVAFRIDETGKIYEAGHVEGLAVEKNAQEASSQPGMHSPPLTHRRNE